MFAKFERFRHRILGRLDREILPTITDPYRQVYETDLIQTRSAGAHSFTGYEHESKYQRRTKVVPIDNTDRFIRGLEHLILDVQIENMTSTRLEPSPFSPKVGTIYYFENQNKYQGELDEVIAKFSRIHSRLLNKFIEADRERVKNIIKEAKEYTPTSDITTDPNWSPGRDHTTGKPYRYPQDH